MMLLAAKRFNDTLARPSLPLATTPLLFAPLRYSSAEKKEEGEKESFERRVRRVFFGTFVEWRVLRLITRRDVRSLRNLCKIVRGVYMYIHICAYNGGSV